MGITVLDSPVDTIMNTALGAAKLNSMASENEYRKLQATALQKELEHYDQIQQMNQATAESERKYKEALTAQQQKETEAFDHVRQITEALNERKMAADEKATQADLLRARTGARQETRLGVEQSDQEKKQEFELRNAITTRMESLASPHRLTMMETDALASRALFAFGVKAKPGSPEHSFWADRIASKSEQLADNRDKGQVALMTSLSGILAQTGGAEWLKQRFGPETEIGRMIAGVESSGYKPQPRSATGVERTTLAQRTEVGTHGKEIDRLNKQLGKIDEKIGQVDETGVYTSPDFMHSSTLKQLQSQHDAKQEEIDAATKAMMEAAVSGTSTTKKPTPKKLGLMDVWGKGKASTAEIPLDKLIPLMDTVAAEHPDWTPEQVAAEAEKRYRG